MRKCREWISLHFLILSLFPPPLSISYIKICHILSQNVKYGFFVANVTKNLTYALWGNNSGSNSLRGSSASCAGMNVITIIHLTWETSDRLAELVCQRIPDLVHMVTPDREYDVHCTSVGYILCMTDPVSSATGKYVFVKLQAIRHYKSQCQLMLYTSWLSWRSRGIYIKSRSKLTPTQPNHPQPLTLYPPHPRTPTPHSMSPQPTCTPQLMGTIR